MLNYTKLLTHIKRTLPAFVDYFTSSAKLLSLINANSVTTITLSGIRKDQNALITSMLEPVVYTDNTPLSIQVIPNYRYLTSQYLDHSAYPNSEEYYSTTTAIQLNFDPSLPAYQKHQLSPFFAPSHKVKLSGVIGYNNTVLGILNDTHILVESTSNSITLLPNPSKSINTFSGLTSSASSLLSGTGLSSSHAHGINQAIRITDSGILKLSPVVDNSLPADTYKYTITNSKLTNPLTDTYVRDVFLGSSIRLLPDDNFLQRMLEEKDQSGNAASPPKLFIVPNSVKSLLGKNSDPQINTPANLTGGHRNEAKLKTSFNLVAVFPSSSEYNNELSLSVCYSTLALAILRTLQGYREEFYLDQSTDSGIQTIAGCSLESHSTLTANRAFYAHVYTFSMSHRIYGEATADNDVALHSMEGVSTVFRRAEFEFLSKDTQQQYGNIEMGIDIE